METIEELRQSNAKLTERLNNAAKFFREQKAQIEALTKENEELKRIPKEEVIDTEKWNALVTEKEKLNKQCNDYELKVQKLENDIKELSDAIDLKDNSYNELTLEKESLKEQLATSNAACADMEKAIRKDLEDIEKLKRENDKLKSDYTVLNDEYLNNENILNETLAANKELIDSNKHLSEQNNDLHLKINEYDIKLKTDKELAEVCEKIKKTYDELKNKYEELTKEIKNVIAEKDELKKNNEELTNTVNTYKKQLTETEAALNSAENVIATINTAVNYHAETAAKKVIKENKQHRIGDEHIMGENIGI